MNHKPTDPDLPDLRQVYEDLTRFREGFSTLLMATIGADAEPEASYAPFVEESGEFYIFVSELSSHTSNLMESGRVAVLFIEDESSTRNLFARRRLSYQCRAEEVARTTDGFETILGRFEGRFGGLITTLKGLSDFHLIRLSPRSARYVTGFAKAFAIDDVALAQIRHIRPT